METNYIRLSTRFNSDKCEEFELNQLALETIITEQKDLSLYLVTMKQLSANPIPGFGVLNGEKVRP